MVISKDKIKRIILISIDNLRFDCVGYQSDKKELERYDVLKYLETPTLDSIAERGLCFTQCISTGTFTTSVHASVFTGLYPPGHGVRAFYEKRLSNDVYTLAEVLSLFGYETVLATDVPQLFNPVNLNRGFRHFFAGDDESLYGFLSKEKDKKIFLFVHYFDVHEPFMFSEYEISPGYNQDFHEAIKELYIQHNLNFPSDININNVHMLWRNFNEHIGKRDINILFPYYVKGVSKFDKGRFRYFVERLREMGYLEDSVLIIFSDHGEGKVYEDNLGYFGHSGALFEDVIKVPLILYADGVGHRIIERPVSLVDIFPTVINLASNKEPHDILPYKIDGIDLVSGKREWTYSEAWLMDEKTNSLSIISTSILLQRAIRTENEKYILYGRPEFLEKEHIENLSNDDLVKGLYRSLLYRFEAYEEYKRMVELLNNGYSRNDLKKEFLNSEEYLHSTLAAILDLNDGVKVRYTQGQQSLHDLPGEVKEHIEQIFRIEDKNVSTEDIFPPMNKDRLEMITGRLFNERHKEIITNIASDKHLFLSLIEDFIEHNTNTDPEEFIDRMYRIFPFLKMDEDKKLYYIRMLEGGVTKKEVFDSILISSGKLRGYLIAEDGEPDDHEKSIDETKDDTWLEANRNLVLMEAEIESLKSQLEQIQNSITWRIGSKFIYFMDHILFPQGTRRQIVFQKLIDKFRRHDHTQTQMEAEKIETIMGSYEKDLNIHNITSIRFNRPEKPRISIVIPVFNSWIYTYNCLKSIYENSPDGLYEIIVVDDASTDHTQEMLNQIDGITVIRSDENNGFIASCNKGAEVARGEFILFLNNDTIVLAGWIEALIKTMENDSRVAIVGSKQILPDGRLLEAGIVVFRDGSSRQYGFGYNPDSPEFNYLREVDAVSGACLMIRRSIWQRIGSFDRRYNFAYYEDMDLCFTVRDLGYKVLYQPHSEIIHFSGVTGVKNTTTRKTFESENRARFQEKWLEKFRSHYTLADIYKARERGRSKYLLVIMYTVPRPDQQSGFLRTFNMLKILSENGYKIALLPDDMEKISPYTEDLQSIGIEVLYGDIDIRDYFKRNGKYFDMVMMVRPEVGNKYLGMIKKHFKKSMLIYDTVDIHFLREQRRAGIEDSSEAMAEAERLKKIELKLARESDLVITVTEDDKVALLREIKKDLRIAVIPNIHDVNPLEKPFKDRRDILFIGGFLHKPNVDAVIYFVNEIFPLIKEELPDVRFYVVGSNPPPEIFDLQSPDVLVTGYVQDVNPYFRNCKLSVAPLRYGAGIKGKITQSLSLGLPVVTTSIGAEGIKKVGEDICLIADAPGEFAEGVLRLYSDETLWEKLRDNGIMYVKDNYAVEAIRLKLVESFSALHPS